MTSIIQYQNVPIHLLVSECKNSLSFVSSHMANVSTTYHMLLSNAVLTDYPTWNI